MRKQKYPGTKQRQDHLAKVKRLAAALYWLACFILTVLEIIKLWNELAG